MLYVKLCKTASRKVLLAIYFILYILEFYKLADLFSFSCYLVFHRKSYDLHDLHYKIWIMDFHGLFPLFLLFNFFWGAIFDHVTSWEFFHFLRDNFWDRSQFSSDRVASGPWKPWKALNLNKMPWKPWKPQTLFREPWNFIFLRQKIFRLHYMFLTILVMLMIYKMYYFARILFNLLLYYSSR